jgi:hypothetical protein
MSGSRQFFKIHLSSTWRYICNYTLILLCASVSFSQANIESSVPSLPPELQYFHQQRSEGPLSIHWVKIDRSQTKFVFITSIAQKKVFGLEPLSQQIQSLNQTLGKPLVAVNGDFFIIRPGPYQGDPSGLQIVQGELVSSPRNTCFWIDPNGQPHIDYVQPAFRATWRDGTNVKFDINQACVDDKAVLYTPAMGPSTRTEKALELILRQSGDSKWLPIKPGQTYNGTILSANQEPNSVIPRDKLVLSLGIVLASKIKNTEPGTAISLSFRTRPDLKDVDIAIGGGPVLIKDAKIQKFTGFQPRHPRTAIGFNDKFFFLLAVDGRQMDLSIGMTLPELADLMRKLGCTEAMNLDGGGSTTFWLDGRVMNSPSDGRERHIANGLILVKKKLNN